MSKKLLLVVPVVALCVLLGWALIPARQSLEAPAYAAWVANPENGLLQTQQQSGVAVSLLYKPLDYIVLHEADATVLSNAAAFEARKAALADLDYYELRIGSALTPEQTAHLASALAESIALESDGHSSAPVLYHYEPAMGLRPHETVLLAFPASTAGTRSITLNDALLGLHQLRFDFDQQTINNVPNLSIL